VSYNNVNVNEKWRTCPLHMNRKDPRPCPRPRLRLQQSRSCSSPSCTLLYYFPSSNPSLSFAPMKFLSLTVLHWLSNHVSTLPESRTTFLRHQQHRVEFLCSFSNISSPALLTICWLVWDERFADDSFHSIRKIINTFVPRNLLITETYMLQPVRNPNANEDATQLCRCNHQTETA
jgi:hypothetical protein